MPPYTVSVDLKARIPILHARGLGVQKICRLLGIKKTLVYKTLNFYRSFGTIENPSRHTRARNRALSPANIEFLIDLLQSKPTIYLDEIQDELLRHQGCCISIPTLFRTLQRLNFSRKRVSAPALEQNETRRAIFMNRVAEIAPDPNMLMFGDEAARDIRTLFRKDGRSLKGSRCVQKKHFLRGTRYSIVPFITLDGIITYEIIEGPVSSERFTRFLREYVVSHCYFMRHVLLLIDTVASSHHSIPRASQCPCSGQLPDSPQ